MTVVISDSLILVPGADFDADNPVIGWNNLVDVGNVSSGAVADDAAIEDIDYPTVNLANQSTYQRFQQALGGEDFWIQVTLDGDTDVDYLAVAGHNFGSKARALRVWGAIDFDINGDPDFTELTQELIVDDNSPLLFRFTPAPYIALRLYVLSSTEASDDIAYAAVLHVGKLLVLERKLQVTFTPLKYGRRSEVLSNRSERGHFLGRTLIGTWVETSASIMYLSPDWYREHMDPFVKAAQTEPFFFAWAPLSYPKEVGYAWLMGEAEPVIHTPVGHIQITLQMQGVTE